MREKPLQMRIGNVSLRMLYDMQCDVQLVHTHFHCFYFIVSAGRGQRHGACDHLLSDIGQHSTGYHFATKKSYLFARLRNIKKNIGKLARQRRRRMHVSHSGQPSEKLILI